MMQFQVLGETLQAELFVFDKDGLLFDSETFWAELAASRAKHFSRLSGSKELAGQWLKAMGAEPDPAKIYRVNPVGVLAAASVGEEIAVTAGFLAEHAGLSWSEARDIAREVFDLGDRDLNLEKALKPLEGFPGIFERLREKRVPYGIATSDTCDRVKTSIRMFDRWESLDFVITPADVSRGKPDREMLDRISAITRIETSKMVMVGDSYLDVSMAEAAGSIGIGVTGDPEMKERMRQFTPWIVDSLEQIIF